MTAFGICRQTAQSLALESHQNFISQHAYIDSVLLQSWGQGKGLLRHESRFWRAL